MFAKARYLAKIGSWAEALAAFDEIIAKEKTSTGKKIDATMEKAKIALFNMVRLIVGVCQLTAKLTQLYVLSGYCTVEGPCCGSQKAERYWR